MGGIASLPAAALRAAEPEPAKVLRPCFGPLRLARRTRALVEDAAPAAPAAWLHAAAEGMGERLRRGRPPVRWLGELTAALGSCESEAAERCREALERALPDPAWREGALLGEVLLAVRTAAQSSRPGRAHRHSEPCVYTPPDLARRMAGRAILGAARVIDPACGAGVFLLAAFERAYTRRVGSGQAPLEAARTILSRELCGVDTDAQALAVARFALRLAGWEAAGLDEDVPLDLRRADALGELPGLEGAGDVCLGNPPFVEGRGLSREDLARLRTRFGCAARGKVNLFAVFVERGLELLRPGGVLAFVLPATFQRNERYRALRELLLRHTLEAIEPLDGAFDRGVETVVLRVRKQAPARGARVELAGGASLQRTLALGPQLRFCDRMPAALRRQVEAMERRGVPLGEHFEVRDGISTGFQPFPHRLLGRVDDYVFVADDGTRTPFEAQKHVRIIDGSEFAAYSPVRWEGRWIEYDKSHEHSPPHPGRPFNCQLRERAIFDRAEKLLTRQTARGLIATVDRERYFVRNSVHVTFAKIPADPPSPGQLERRAYGGRLASPERGRRKSDRIVRGLSLPALCACLNSKYYERYFLAVTGEHGKVFPQVHIADLKRLPLLPTLLHPGEELHTLGEELLSAHLADGQEQDRIAALRACVENLLVEAFEGQAAKTTS